MDRGDVLYAAKGGGAVFGGRLFAWGTRFLLAVLLARLLGAEQYGLYTLAFTVVTVAASFPTLGLDSALVRYTAVYAARGDWDRLAATIRLAVGVPALLGIVGAAIVGMLSLTIAQALTESDLAPLLVVACVIVPAMVINRQVAAILQGFRRVHLAVAAEQVMQPLVRAILLVLFAVIGLSAALALVASAAAALTVTLVLIIVLVRVLPVRWRGGDSRAQVGEMARFSLPVFFSNVVTTFGTNLQTLFLAATYTATHVGIFAVASQVNLIGHLFHTSVVAASMPLFAEMEDRGDRRSLARLYQTTSKWSLSLNLPVFMVVVLFPDALLAIFGSEFEQGAAALVILAWANFATAATGTSGAVLDMTGHTWVKFINSTAALVLAIGLSVILIPPLGVVGAALAALGSVAGTNLLRVVQVRWLVGVVPYNRTFLKPIAAGLLAGGAAFAVSRLLEPLGLVVEVAVGTAVLVAVYGGALLLLGMEEEDRLVLGRIRDRLLRRRRPRGATRRGSTSPSSSDGPPVDPAVASLPRRAGDQLPPG